MNYIIFDLEATCWPEKGKHISEIIEIGALKISDKQIIVSEFNCFIKPINHPILSEFCKNLTSITQAEIDKSELFPSVIEKFRQWIDLENEDYLLCSWGYYDRKQLIADCNLHQFDFEWASKHISLKHQYADIKKLNRPIGLGKAISSEGMQFEGTAHRGINDAKNIARIFLRYFNDWELNA